MGSDGTDTRITKRNVFNLHRIIHAFCCFCTTKFESLRHLRCCHLKFLGEMFSKLVLFFLPYRLVHFLINYYDTNN